MDVKNVIPFPSVGILNLTLFEESKLRSQLAEVNSIRATVPDAVCMVEPVIVTPEKLPAVMVQNVPLAATRVPPKVAFQVVPSIENVVFPAESLPRIPFGLIRRSPDTQKEYVPIWIAHDTQKVKAPRIFFADVSKEVFITSFIKFPEEFIAAARVAVDLPETVPIKSRVPSAIVYLSREASAALPKYIQRADIKYPAFVASEKEVFPYDIVPPVSTIEEMVALPFISTLKGASTNLSAQSHKPCESIHIELLQRQALKSLRLLKDSTQ